MADLITRRSLNRTTLGRQLLLERMVAPVEDVIERLLGMQGQNPHDPYYGLWARVEGFDPEQLSGMMARGEAVRGALMRATLHLATTPDFLMLRSQLQPTLAAVLGSTVFAKDTREVDREQLLGLGRRLLEEKPMTRAELGPLLEEKWLGVPGSSLAQVVTYLLPLVQVPPRGLWGRSGPAAWTTIEAWTGREVPTEVALERTVLRYLAAFGPASVADMRVWSGLRGLRPVMDRLLPKLRRLRTEDGAELFDLPDAPIRGEDTPAPPRLLPEYDNVLLGHDDRSRFFAGGIIPPGWLGNLLVDGVYSGAWKIDRPAGRIQVTVMRKISKQDRAAVEAEAARLVALATPGAGGAVVLIDDFD